jgi:hypothetical protein
MLGWRACSKTSFTASPTNGGDRRQARGLRPGRGDRRRLGLYRPVIRPLDTWQLVINTGTTIVTFLIVFLIQNTQNRDAMVMQLKLDELIRALRTHEPAGRPRGAGRGGAEGAAEGVQELHDRAQQHLHERMQQRGELHDTLRRRDHQS